MGGLIDAGGEKEAIRWAKTLTKGIRRDIVKYVSNAEKSMVENARTQHKFTTITGEVDNSISAVTKVKGNILSFTFFMKPVVMSSGYNKSWILNDGTYGNYKRGAISPSAVTVGGKRGTGIKSDDFMGRSWNKNYKVLDRRITKAFDRMR